MVKFIFICCDSVWIAQNMVVENVIGIPTIIPSCQGMFLWEWVPGFDLLPGPFHNDLDSLSKKEKGFQSHWVLSLPLPGPFHNLLQ